MGSVPICAYEKRQADVRRFAGRDCIVAGERLLPKIMTRAITPLTCPTPSRTCTEHPERQSIQQPLAEGHLDASLKNPTDHEACCPVRRGPVPFASLLSRLLGLPVLSQPISERRHEIAREAAHQALAACKCFCREASRVRQPIAALRMLASSWRSRTRFVR